MLLWYARSLAAARYAERQGAPGVEFNRFGRRMGWRLIRRGELRKGVSHLLAPLNGSRYLEFPVARSYLPRTSGHCLDVSSPRLFSLYVASLPTAPRIQMINPDPQDLATTSLILRSLGIRNVEARRATVDALEADTQVYDCIWSISVVEHISGDYDDTHAVRVMYDRLRKGGRLILTVPVDRRFREEFRSEDVYGTQAAAGDLFFFQRVYDEEALYSRLLSPLGARPSVLRWFGETCPGIWNEYERRAMRDGLECIVDDPREMADHYREYDSWTQMPGVGICGLMIERE
ncbi:MAG: hypothetical protein GEU73_02210 [Chloroflexi bacterium]|nr:hypothetical protein [Chloroflexota bacterium]